MTVLMSRPWPDNVRELQNVVRRVVMFCPQDIITVEDFNFFETRARPVTEAGTADSRLTRKRQDIKGDDYR